MAQEHHHASTNAIEMTETQGGAIALTYLILTLWGILCGVGIGWLVWG